jgi:hypothetical protein
MIFNEGKKYVRGSGVFKDAAPAFTCRNRGILGIFQDS